MSAPEQQADAAEPAQKVPDEAEKERAKELRRELRQRGPWGMDVEVSPGPPRVRTDVSLRPMPAMSMSASERHPFVEDGSRQWRLLVNKIWPDGFRDRSFLDYGTDCGGRVFWSKELGAGSCLGVDRDEQAISQAKYLLERRAEHWPSDDVRFEQSSAAELAKNEGAKFDLAYVGEAFTRTPEPMSELRHVAGLTRQVMVLDLPFRTDRPDLNLALAPGSMRAEGELRWLPTGTFVLRKLLVWLGFPYASLFGRVPAFFGSEVGRIRMIGGREEGMVPGAKLVRGRTQEADADHG